MEYSKQLKQLKHSHMTIWQFSKKQNKNRRLDCLSIFVSSLLLHQPTNPVPVSDYYSRYFICPPQQKEAVILIDTLNFLNRISGK